VLTHAWLRNGCDANSLGRQDVARVSKRPGKEKKVKVQVPGDKLNEERMGVKVVERMCVPS
jgi:hypothetical protein